MSLRNPDMVTTNGHFIYFDKPELAVVDSEDLRLGLSNIRRYNGGLDWTLNRHVLLVGKVILKLAKILVSVSIPEGSTREREVIVQAGFGVAHDFHEIYLTDVVNGLKKHLSNYSAIEDRWEEHVHNAIGLPYHRKQHRIVKDADMLALVSEMEYLGHPSAEMCQKKFGFTKDQVNRSVSLVSKIAIMSEQQVWEEIKSILIPARHILWEEQLNKE